MAFILDSKLVCIARLSAMPAKAKKPVKFSKFKRHITNSIRREYEPVLEDVQKSVELWKDGYDELEKKLPSRDELQRTRQEVAATRDAISQSSELFSKQTAAWEQDRAELEHLACETEKQCVQLEQKKQQLLESIHGLLMLLTLQLQPTHATPGEAHSQA